MPRRKEALSLGQNDPNKQGRRDQVSPEQEYV